MSIQTELLLQIVDERRRQDAKWGEQDHIPAKWLSIMAEQMGKACQAALKDDARTYQEKFISVAAVAVAALECLDRQYERFSKEYTEAAKEATKETEAAKETP